MRFFEIAKEEQFVLDNGQAERGAKLVLMVVRNARQFPVTSVKDSVAQVFPKISVNPVRSGLQTDNDYSASGVAELRAVI